MESASKWNVLPHRDYRGSRRVSIPHATPIWKHGWSRQVISRETGFVGNIVLCFSYTEPTVIAPGHG
jgi:hypothetical protein